MKTMTGAFPRRGFPRLRWLLPVLLGLVLLLAVGGQLNLWHQDNNIAAPSGQPGPNDPCFQGDVGETTYEHLIAQRQQGVNLVRVERPYNANSGLPQPIEAAVYIRYTNNGAAHVLYPDASGSLVGFRISAETLHRELGELPYRLLYERIRVVGSRLPAGSLQSFINPGDAMAFIQWAGFICPKR